MLPSSQIQTELKKCEALLEEMSHAISSQEFEDRWQQFLGHLERIWNKSQNHFGKSPKWNGWRGRFDKQRKTDPLLSYLSNARGAHEHSVDAITENTPGSIAIGAGPFGSVYIKNLKIDSGVVHGEWIGDLSVTFIPEKVNPVSVKNRGRIYPVPEEHLGEKMLDKSALTYGRLGLTYYKRFVAHAEAFFIK